MISDKNYILNSKHLHQWIENTPHFIFNCLFILVFICLGFTGFDIVSAEQPYINDKPSVDIEWIEKTPMPVPVGAFGYAVVDNIIYIIGGDMHTTGSMDTVQRYDPASEIWEVDTNNGGTLAPLPHPRGFIFCGVINRKIHAIGGWENGTYKNDHFIYDPDTNIWSSGPAIPQYPIGQFATTVNDKIYVFGGWWGNYKDLVYEYTDDSGWISRSPMPTARNHGTTAVYDGKVYVIAGANGSGASIEPLDIVEIYDPETDTWTTGLLPMPDPQTYLGSSGSPVSNGVIYVLGPLNTSYGYNPQNDSWETLHPMPGEAYGINTINGLIYVIGSEHTFQGVSSPWPMFHHDAQHTGRSPYIGTQDNTIFWTYETGNDITSSPAIGYDNIIYVGSNDHNLYAINQNGTLKWTYETRNNVTSSPAIGHDGTIYIGSKDHNLYAINSDGTLQWNFSTGGEINAPPTIGNDGRIYVGSSDHKLYILHSNGTLKCSYDTGHVISSAPAIGSDGIIYVGSSNGILTALYPNCTVKWISTPPIHGIWTHPAISSDGLTIYHGADDGYLYARYTSNGSIKWKSPWTYGGIQSSPVIGSNGTVYVGTQYGNLWAINPEDGSLEWDIYTTLSTCSSPAIGADGTIYFATDYGHIYAVNQNGTIKWTYSGNFSNDGHFHSSPAIGSNGAIYIGSTNGNVYAFWNAPPVKNLDTEEYFETIQAAIDDDDTLNKHTITVDPGTYTENVNLNKQLTIRSTSGNHVDTIVQAADSFDHIFEVTVDYVNISGFTVTEASGGKAGIYLNTMDNCNISYNNVSNNSNGIYLGNSENNTLSNNIVKYNTDSGIWLYFYNKNNKLSYNIVNSNIHFGIALYPIFRTSQMSYLRFNS